jgi:hypothetical protein
MNRNFLLTGVITAIINLLLHGFAYAVFLKGFYENHPAGPEEFTGQPYRPSDQLIVWAMVVTSLAFGFFITTMMKWSGAGSFFSGLKYGFLVAFLFWSSVNFGLYASSRFFSLAGVFADLACSTAVMTISGASAAWMLGSGSAKN